MANLNAALVQQFLHVSVTQGKEVIEPNGMLDDGHGETVAVGLGVGHGQSAYPDPIKATQPPEVPGLRNLLCSPGIVARQSNVFPLQQGDDSVGEFGTKDANPAFSDAG